MSERPYHSDRSRALYTCVYEELRVVARRYLSRERSSHILQATALANEAYVCLANSPASVTLSRIEYFRLAARVMRRVLLNYARDAGRKKRGGGRARVDLDPDLDPDLVQTARPVGDRLDFVESALEKLSVRDARLAEIVQLRFYAGFSVAEIGQLMGMSTAQVKRNWSFAKAWLRREMTATDQ